jgi:hypothetical protein
MKTISYLLLGAAIFLGSLWQDEKKEREMYQKKYTEKDSLLEKLTYAKVKQDSIIKNFNPIIINPR